MAENIDHREKTNRGEGQELPHIAADAVCAYEPGTTNRAADERAYEPGTTNRAADELAYEHAIPNRAADE